MRRDLDGVEAENETQPNGKTVEAECRLILWELGSRCGCIRTNLHSEKSTGCDGLDCRIEFTDTAELFDRHLCRPTDLALSCEVRLLRLIEV